MSWLKRHPFSLFTSYCPLGTSMHVFRLLVLFLPAACQSALSFSIFAKSKRGPSHQYPMLLMGLHSCCTFDSPTYFCLDWIAIMLVLICMCYILYFFFFKKACLTLYLVFLFLWATAQTLFFTFIFMNQCEVQTWRKKTNSPETSALNKDNHSHNASWRNMFQQQRDRTSGKCQWKILFSVW